MKARTLVCGWMYVYGLRDLIVGWMHEGKSIFTRSSF